MARARRTDRIDRAHKRLSMAKMLYGAGQGSAVGMSALLAAHCEACQAMADAADANDKALFHNAAEFSIQIARALERAPKPNPGLRRFKDLATATRDADRRALRTKNPHYVYRLKSKPQFAVLPSDHPVQGSIESGAIAMGDARLLHTANPSKPDPLSAEAHARALEEKGADLHALAMKAVRIASKKGYVTTGLANGTSIISAKHLGYIRKDARRKDPRYLLTAKGRKQLENDGASGNPIDTKAKPPRFLAGYPADTEWEYKGRRIRVHQRPNGDYRAEWKEPSEEGMERGVWGHDQQEALANARHTIDVYDRDLWHVDDLINHVIDRLDSGREKISRSTVARAIELARAGHLPLPAGVNAEYYRKFDALSLEDRLHMIDEAIKYQARAGLLDPKNVTLPNPARSRRVGGGSGLRRLLRR